MNNFRGGRPGGRPGGRRDFRERPEMHDAICDKCGASCEVPFRPSGDKPIFCNDCFHRRDGRGDRPRQGTDSCQGAKMLLEQMSVKLDKILAALTAPQPVKEAVKKKKKSKV